MRLDVTSRNPEVFLFTNLQGTGYVSNDPVNNSDPSGLFLPIPSDLGYLPPDLGILGSGYGYGGGFMPSSLGGGGGGGGGGGTPWYRLHPCDKSDPTNAKIINFIDAQQAQAQVVANDTGLSADFIMGWAAYESGWGLSNAATQDNNYFGLKPSRGADPVHWAGSDPYSTCKVQGYDCFTSQVQGLEASAISALSSFNNKYLYAALAAAYPGGLAQQIAQAIVDAGFNNQYDPGVYAGIVVIRANMIKIRENCPK